MSKEESKRQYEVALSQNMRPKEAARYTGVSASKLAKLRMRGNRSSGPRFIKVVGCIVYSKDDLDAWLNEHAINV